MTMTTPPQLTSPEALFRQVHPKFLQEGKISAQAFMPGSDSTLSVARGSKVDAEAANARFVAQGRESAASARLALGDFDAESIPVFDDPNEADDAHAFAQYEHVPRRKDREKIASRLRAKASVAYERLPVP